MNVLHLISSLRHGGAETLVTMLMPHLRKRGAAVEVVSLLDATPLRARLDDEGISLVSLSHAGTIYSASGMLRSFQKLRTTIRERQPDVVHSHLYLPDLLARLAAPRRCRLISTLHGQDPWWSEASRLRSRAKTWLDRTSGYLREARYISVSSQVHTAACEALSIEPSINRIIHNGIDLAKFRPRQDNAPHPLTIIQVGRFYREKSHHTTLRAFALLTHTIPDAQLLLIGDGPLRSELEIEAARLGIQTAVTFMGIREDIPHQLSNADLFWMPSEREGSPLACLEAMAAGLPVIASAVGGLSELIEPGINGCLIRPGNAEELAETTIDLFRNPRKRRRLSDNALTTVHRSFSIEATADHYIQAYRDLMSGAW
jgi:glycosyltransferase involved in cell wall biosynthesis